MKNFNIKNKNNKISQGRGKEELTSEKIKLKEQKINRLKEQKRAL